MKNNQLVIVGTVGVPACYGGFETLVENLLENNDTKLLIYCSRRAYKDKLETYKGASLYYLPFNANGLQSIPYDILSILHALSKGHRDFLVLGVSGAVILPIVKLLFPSARFVTNIDGLEWQRKKWGSFTRWFLKFSEYLAVSYSDDVISDNQAIAEYVSSEYGKDSDVIAYGGDHALIKHKPLETEDYALSLCRIEPENNVHIILEAFSCSDKALKFIGNWDYSEYGRSLKKKYLHHPNIEIIDPVYCNTKLYEYRSKCKFYVHGHSAGGTNPSLVEIMHFAKQIVAFDCIYNRATLEGHGRYFNDVNSLRSIITIPEFNVDGYVFREIANRRYTWNVVRHQYLSLLNQRCSS